MSRGLGAILLIGVLAGGAWIWWHYFPDSLPTIVDKHTPRSPQANPPLYKWRNAEGVWQITDAPPTDLPYETVVVDPQRNVVPTVIPGQTKAPDGG